MQSNYSIAILSLAPPFKVSNSIFFACPIIVYPIPSYPFLSCSILPCSTTHSYSVLLTLSLHSSSSFQHSPLIFFFLLSFFYSFIKLKPSRDFNLQHSRPVMSYDDIQPVATEYIRYKVSAYRPPYYITSLFSFCFFIVTNSFSFSFLVFLTIVYPFSHCN